MNRKTRIIMLAFISVSLLGLAGCKPKRSVITAEEMQGIKTVAIVTELVKEGVQVIDHTGSDNPMAVQSLGIIGALLNEGVKNHYKKSSMGGNFDTLEAATSDFDGREYIDNRIAELFVTDFKTIMVGQPDMSIIKVSRKNKKGQRIKTRDYSKVAKLHNAELILEINYVYGLATYPEKSSSSVAIRAFVKVVRVKDQELILQKVLSSDAIYRRGFTVDRFAEDEAGLFKRELNNAAIAFTHILAKEFGAITPIPVSMYWGTWGVEEKR